MAKLKKPKKLKMPKKPKRGASVAVMERYLERRKEVAKKNRERESHYHATIKKRERLQKEISKF